MRKSYRRILLILGLSLLLALGCASASADSSYTIANNGDWSGTLTNLDMSQATFKTHAELDWDNPYWTAPFPMSFLKIPNIKAGIEFKLGATGDFDVTISQANLNENQNTDSTIRYNEENILIPGKKMYRERIDKGNIFDDLPSALAYGLGAKAGVYFVAASTHPVRVQGSFKYYDIMEVSVENGIQSRTEQDFSYTSIKPLNPKKDQRTVVFVGSQYELSGEFISIQNSILKIGPILALEADLMGGAIAEGVVHKDEMEFERYADWDTDVIHSCTENGKDGCLDGEYRLVSSEYAFASVNLKAKFTAMDRGIDILEKQYPIKSSYKRDSKQHFVQSLTWREKLKKQEYCSHLYYKVPVAVWANANKTIPISGIYVHQKGISSEDSNMTKYTVAWTGKNTKIPPPDQEGKAVLYLPYINGKYTIMVDSLNNEHEGDNDKRIMGGSAEQPENMKRGANKQVDIILECNDKTEYKVEKTWDIDIEGKDKPESIEVLLQARYSKWDVFSWEGVRTATLSAANNWSFTFTDVPTHAMNAKGQMTPVEYRIRELKEKSGGGDHGGDGGDGAAGLAANDDSGVIQDTDGLFRPDSGKYAEESKRVVPSRFDLDNIHVWDAVKSRMTDISKIIEFEPTAGYVKGLAKSAFFPSSEVSYKVKAFDTMYGEHFDDHTTRYLVSYDVSDEGKTTKITNTAILSFSMHKIWVMLGESEPPDSVYLTLLYRPSKAFREHVGMPESSALWIPVINPLDGNKINIIGLLGDLAPAGVSTILETVAKLDIANKLSIPIAVGKAKERKGLENPLNAWRVRFLVKKYGYVGMPGIPVEFTTAELTSVVLKNVVKYLTGFDIPASLSLNLSGPYVSAWGTPFQLSVLDKEWEYTSDIINTWYEGSPNFTKQVTGVKTWVHDKKANRPEYIDILLKDKDTDTLIATARVRQDKCVVTVNGTETSTYDTKTSDESKWVWLVTNKDVPDLDEDEQYTIEEKFPEGYQYADSYSCSINGYDLRNYWETPIRVVIRNVFDPAGATRPTNLKIRIRDGAGNRVGREDGYPLSGSDTLTLTNNAGEGIDLNKTDISKLVITETFNQPADGTTWAANPVVTGPVKTAEDGWLTYTFTVTHQADVPIRVKVKKEWKDDEGKSRPAQVAVYLKRDGSVTEPLPVMLDEQNNWEAQFTQNLPRFNADTGEEYVYSVAESTPAGYFASVSEEVTTVQEDNKPVILHTFTVTNSADTVTVKGTKNWVNDNESTRKPIIVQVMTEDGAALDRSGSPIEKRVTGEGENGWTWEFTDLPAKNLAGNGILYSVTERPADVPASGANPLEGYEVTYAEPVFDAETKTWICDITNTFQPQPYQVFVFKAWDDNEDEAGTRPEKVTVELSGGGQARSAELSGETDWIGVFTDLEKPDKAAGIAYTAAEQAVENYNPKYNRFFDDADTGIVIITNTLDDSRMDIPVIKVWENDGESTSARPDSVTVRLYRKDAQGTETEAASPITLTAETGWEGTFRDIPKYTQDEEPITYTVKEDPSGDSLYRLKSVEPAEITGENFYRGVTVTNEFIGITVTVRKEWVNASSLTLPDEVAFTLYRGNDEEVLRGKLTKADNWTADFGVPKTGDDGQAIAYTVREAKIPNCTAEYPEPVTDEQGNVTITVINTVTGVDIPVEKVWDDGNDPYGNRPESITLNLYAGSGENAVPVESVTLTADTGWKGAFKDLPLYREMLLDNPDTRTYIDYSVKEADVPGYTSAVTQAAGTDQYPSFTVTNTPVFRDIIISKVWEDEENRLGFRPDAVSVALMEGAEPIREISLSQDNNWTCTVTVPEMIGGQEAAYEVLEKDVPDRYLSSLSGTTEDGFTITNTLKPVTTDIMAIKEWEDVPGEYPEITLRLMSDREKEGEYKEAASFTLNADTGWTYVFKDMPLYADDGRVIGYDLEEDRLPGFGSPVVLDIEYLFIVYNRQYEETSWLLVEKQWDDQENLDGIRPDRVTVELLRNGKPTGKTTELSEETAWFGVFEDLERTDETGKWISYSVREDPVEGYEAKTESYLGELEDPGVFFWKITNTHEAGQVFTITFDPNGGTLHGSRDPEKSEHGYGEEISIPPAPVRAGYHFLYWKGSEYYPGDHYSVTGDHTFTAQWERDGGSLDYRFTFTKKWSGASLDSIDWTMYNPDGSVRHKKFNKKKVSETEWQYDAWFAEGQDYYIVENVPAGYEVRYENVGVHAGETDRCYNGGTIINYMVPKTGDDHPLLLWVACILLGAAGLSALAYRLIRQKRKQ